MPVDAGRGGVCQKPRNPGKGADAVEEAKKEVLKVEEERDQDNVYIKRNGQWKLIVHYETLMKGQ